MSSLIQDSFIFFAKHMVLAFVVFAALWAGLDRWGPSHRGLDRLSPVFGRRLAVVMSLVVLVIFALIGGWYLTLDGFAGEVEPVVSSLSWLVQNGHPLYHEIEAAQRYSVLYGPSVFLTNGLFLQVLGPSLFSAKLASFFGVLGCLFLFHAALTRSSRDWVALLVTSLAALYFWSQGFAVYLVRPDALLLFSVGLALFTAVKTRRVIALVTVAVMLGFAVNLKVHAVVYFFPVLAILGDRFGWRRVLLTVAGSVVVILAPFVLHPQVSALNYLEWLRNAIDHGLVTETVSATLQFAACLLLPLGALLLISPIRAQHVKRHRVVLASLAPTYVLTLILAAKPGAGLVHLLPLIPTTLYLVGVILRDLVDLHPWVPASHPRFSLRGILVALFLAALLSGTVNVYRAVRLVDWQVQQAPNLAGDIRGIMEQYPDLTLGMACGGENNSFFCTWLRPLLVFANHPLVLEPIAVMECQLTGKEMPQEIYQALENGVVSLWLVPRDKQPFAKLNWYPPHDPVFSERFIKHFESLYSRRGQSLYFDLWFWNGLEQTGKAPGGFTGNGQDQ